MVRQPLGLSMSRRQKNLDLKTKTKQEQQVEEQSEANRASQTQVIIVFNDIKAAVRAVLGVQLDRCHSADLRVAGKKIDRECRPVILWA